MAFPTTGILDNFNRANEGPPPSASWSTPAGLSGCVVSSNQCAAAAANGFAVWNTSYNDAQECYATIAVMSGSVAVFARMQNTGSGATLDGYSVVTGGTTIYIQRIDNGGATTLGSPISQTVSAGDAIGIVVNGSSIQSWYKASGGSWTLIDTQTDSTYSGSGQPAVVMTDTTARLDDFGGGTVVVTLEQEGFRFRNDDGSESAATWRQAQDTDDSVAVETAVRLRMIVNATGDPPTKQYQLQYRPTGGHWTTVET